MRKYIILFIALCLQVAARGQTVLDELDLSGLPQPTQAKALRYWFDDDAGSVQTSSQLTGTHTLDVSSLIEGLHTLHYQVIDTEDRAAYVCSTIFLKVNSQTSATPTKLLRYWFDDETKSTESILSGGIRTIDVSTLIDGLHTIHYQVVGDDGQAYYVASGLFLKTGTNTGTETLTASKLMYWFDDETTMQYVNVTGGVQMLDASGLMEGLHTLHYQVLCNNGQMTPSTSSLFLRLSIDVETTTAQSLRYWFDDEQTATEVEVTNGVQTLDASGLIEGLHTVHYQIADSKGTLGAPASSVFLKMDYDSVTSTAKSIRYWFDDDATTVQVTDVANGSQTLDVADIPMGLHTLNYQLIDSNGKVSVPGTRIFMKSFDKVIASGHNSITRYQYWLNNNTATVQTVTLDAAVNPYTLIALLPMQTEPLRSGCFHFEKKDGKPMIYAKNDFHIRFTDAAGYFVDDSRQFIDYSVSREVEPVGELQGTQTFPKVTANDVRWYTMQVAPGDTAAFRLSQPATVQVFAPSGAEVFKTSESASVKWGGIHTWENGTYYLAVHDVTGSQSTMKLEYMHMDKYDVVDWDVHTVGNGGCSTITFKGNGFRDLYAVDLVVAPGDTIHSVDVSHDSDAETAVTFDFTGATLGEYNAVFHFTEEDKPVASVVMVEEAVDIELATDVSFPSSFLRGTSTTYTIKITNKGNMTAYTVPIYTFIRCHDTNDIYNIKYDGLGLTSLIDGIDTDGMSSDEIEKLRNTLESIGDAHHFLKFRTEYENKQNGDSATVLSNYFLVNLAPNTTRTMTLTISTNQYAVEVYVTTPKEWLELTYTQEENGVKRYRLAPRRAFKDWFCCYREGIECVADLVVSLADVGSLVMGIVGAIDPALLPVAGAVSWADCALSIGNSGLKAAGEFACGSGEEKLKKQLQNAAKAAGKSALGATLSCISAKLSSVADLAKLKGKILAGISSELSGNVVGMDIPGLSCVTKFTKPIPNCPPNPGGGGGGSTPQPPVDPNDIYGYLSEAGSKFIADSVARVNYTIEFENDTTFATAAAHTIVIKDTLDSWYFDLTKFTPTGVRIGSREVFLDEADVVTNNNKTSFVKTIDMRPEINAIAQVNGEFNQKNGIAQWTFQSLDPMTMEPTDDLMQGILPVNYNGTSGIGEVMFEVGVKSGKADGTQIKNRVGIVFDYEEAILTPTWTNIVDAVAPKSFIDEVVHENDSTISFRFYGEDNASGIWKYRFYVQAGQNAPWWEEATNIAPDSTFSYRYYDNIDYGFYVVAIDSAGNVEKKVIQRECSFKAHEGDYEVNIDEVNGQWSTVNGQSIYDLSGRRQAVPRRGVNIIDDKKVLKR